MIEGLTDEVMTLLEQSRDGLTSGELFEASDLADDRLHIGHAVNRLMSQGLIVKSTDKRWRTKAQAEALRAQSAKPAPKPTKKVVKKKAAAKPAAKPAQKPADSPAQAFSSEICGLPTVSDRLAAELDAYAKDARALVDDYLERLGDPMLEALLKLAEQAQHAAAAAQRALEVAGRE